MGVEPVEQPAGRRTGGTGRVSEALKPWDLLVESAESGYSGPGASGGPGGPALESALDAAAASAEAALVLDPSEVGSLGCISASCEPDETAHRTAGV